MTVDQDLEKEMIVDSYKQLCSGKNVKKIVYLLYITLVCDLNHCTYIIYGVPLLVTGD